MATVGAGYSFGASETVTNAKLGTLLSSATVTSIVNADVDAGAAIANSKLNLATITQAITHSGGLTETGGLTVSTTAQTMTSVPINHAKGADIASVAGVTDIGAATGNSCDVTGTNTITGLGTVQAGTLRFVRFTGILILTHNATSLILPAAANITTAAADSAIFLSLGSGNWRCENYYRKDGTALTAFTASTAPAGTTIQVVNTITGAVATGTTLMINDDTIPQITEGDQYMTLAITPNNSSNKLKIDVVVNYEDSDGGFCVTGLFQDATANALASVMDNRVVGYCQPTAFTHYMAAGTTSSTTFRVRIGPVTGGTITFNGIGAGRKMGGIMASSITITEIKA